MSEQNSNMTLTGHIKMEVVRDGELIDTLETKNLILNLGFDHVLDGCFGLDTWSEVTSWYVGLLGNYTPVADTTGALLATNEFIAYDEATREAYVGVRTTTTVSNTDSPAEFTISADSSTVYGAFLTSNSAISSGTDTFVYLAAGEFTAARTGLMDGDLLYVTYEITAANAQA